MGTDGVVRGLRALAMACGLVLALGMQRPASAETAPRTDIIIEPASEPIGPATANVAAGGLYEKWASAVRAIDADLIALASCELGDCTPAARQFLSIVQKAQARNGRALLGEINRSFNLALRAASDLSQYGAEDVWASPLQTLASGAGDCEDYAIAKWVALRYAGMAVDDLRLLIVRDKVRHEDHAILAARFEGRWLTLDNRRMAMVDAELLPQVAPMFSISEGGIKRYDAVTRVADNAPPAAPASIMAQRAAIYATDDSRQ